MSEEKKAFTEELKIKGSELAGKVKELIAEGNVRKIVILKENGDVLLEVPMNAGVAVGGVLTMLAPVLAGLGAATALLTNVRVRIERTDKDEEQ
ncbi:MAG: DUF4342 domain-containing protein [Spirochaetales bacterium]|jgi:hypothetical protein|nr:DUF4342 domain-containing protein [Spirochaetales bacterium]